MPAYRACAECHRVKCKCVFSEQTQSKCDRCTRLNRGCVPHLSKQGQRKKEGNKETAGVVAAFVVASEVSDASTVGSEGCYSDPRQDQILGFDASLRSVPNMERGNIFTPSHTGHNSHVAASSCMPHQNDDPFSSMLLDQRRVASTSESRMPSPPAAANITREQSCLVNQQQQTSRTTHHTKKNISSTNRQDVAENNGYSPVRSVPLREWIKCARDFDDNNLISPKYLASCLQVALSLSKALSDAEDFSCDVLRSMPIDIANWGDFVTVKLKENEAGNFSAHDEPSTAQTSCDELALLEAWFDKVCQEEKKATSSSDKSSFYNIDSAEISTHDTTLDANDVELLSPEERRHRIYALGLVFYELFSGGRLPPPEFLPAFFYQNTSMTLSFRGTLNLSDFKLNKLGHDDEVFSDVRGRPMVASTPQVKVQSFIEPLKLIGLSYRLCDLLNNMLDCINGDMTGDEAYVTMSDVTSDLKLMIDKPLKFLHDPDVVNISSVGLQMNDMLVKRDRELESLEEAYRRASEGSSEFAIITGGSGTGKSFLAFRLGRHITDCGGIFLSVKFDPVAQAKPFSALMSAFNEYCNMFTAMKDSDWVKAIATKLQDELGCDANHLIKIIPNLSEILNNDAADEPLDQGCVNGLKKIHYLLIRFVEVISACSKVTVSLLLDDLQWADAFSLSVLEEIFKMPDEDKRFFFIGCYRDDEMKNDHPFQKIMDTSSAYGIRLTMVHIDCMRKDEVNMIISDFLCLSPRLVNSLSDIVYSKTKGNLLFLSRLLISLYRDGLLSFSLGRRRWVWDEEQIRSMELPDDVALFFSNGILALSPQVQTAIQALACFGSAYACELLILESKLSLELLTPLELAVHEGFVSKKDQQYCFSHDKILQAAYEMVRLEDRCLQHLQYGICLLNVYSEAEDPSGMLFKAVGQINLAGPSVVTDPTQSIDFAAYNLLASEKAIELSEYAAAAVYAKSGISFLEIGNHWTVHYNLSLKLFELATRCMLVLGDFTTLAKLSDEVCRNARSIEDKIETLLAVMTSLAYASKISGSVAMGLSILSQLDHQLPTTVALQNILASSKQKLQDLSLPDDILLTYKEMTETRHLMAMKCLAKLEMTTSLANPDLQPLITLKMIELTVGHGLSSTSSIGFAYFASLLLKHGEMPSALRFARLAMHMQSKVGSNEFAGEVCYTTTEVLCFYSPLPSVNEYRLQGQDVALAAGDVHFACGLKLAYCMTSFWAGSNLLTLKDAFTQAGRYMKGQNHSTSYNCLLLSYDGILSLLGDEAEDNMPTVDQLTNPLQQQIFFFQNMFSSFILNEYADMKQYAEKFFEDRKFFTFRLSYYYAMQEFYGGLASFRIYRETGDTQWLDRGRQCKSAIKIWAEEGSSWNFEQKHFLLEAEEQYCQFNILAAKELYTSAITTARSHKFINDEALAYELAGYFYLQVGMATASLQHLTGAHKKYIEWGASRKVNKIFDFIQEKFGDDSFSSGVLAIKSVDENLDSRKRRLL